MNTHFYGSISMSLFIRKLNKKTMFKKLLSNLPFNPSLIGQVSFYAQRMRSESALRRTGFVFMGLTMLVQMFAVVSPPQPTLAESSNDIVRGGFDDLRQAVLHCLNPSEDFGKILAYYGITCDTLSAANPNPVTLNSRALGGSLDSLGRNPVSANHPTTGNASNQYDVRIPGVSDLLHMKNLWYWDSGASSSYRALDVRNRSGRQIWIIMDCGNIVTQGPYSPPAAPAPPPPPPPQPLNRRPAMNFEANCSTIIWRATDPDGGPRVRLYIATSTVNPDTDWANKGPFVHSVAPTGSGTTNDGQWSIPSQYRNTTRYRVFAAVSDKLPSGVMDDTNFVRAAPTIGVLFGPCTTTPPPPPLPPPPPVPPTTPQPPPPPPPTDVCPLISGVQLTNEECDVCKNIPGDQTSVNQCYPCPGATSETNSVACIRFDKTASNDTQKLVNADKTTAQAGDVITYTLKVTNTGPVEVKDFVITEELNDVLEYSDVVNLNGGKLDASKIASWPKQNIAPNATIQKQIVIKVKSPVPGTPVSSSDPGSFDLIMTNVFYDKSINIFLPDSPLKTIERTTQTLPNTGPGESLAAGFALTLIIAYFFARSRLFATELDIVRHDFSNGGI